MGWKGQLNFTRFLKLQFDLEAVAFFDGFFEAHDHQVMGTRLELDSFATGHIYRLDFTHFHDIAMHAHEMQLHRVCKACAGRQELVIGPRIAYREITSCCGLA